MGPGVTIIPERFALQELEKGGCTIIPGSFTLQELEKGGGYTIIPEWFEL